MTHFNIIINGQVKETEISKSNKVSFTFNMLFDIYLNKIDNNDKLELTRWTQGENELTILKSNNN